MTSHASRLSLRTKARSWRTCSGSSWRRTTVVLFLVVSEARSWHIWIVFPAMTHKLSFARWARRRMLAFVFGLETTVAMPRERMLKTDGALPHRRPARAEPHGSCRAAARAAGFRGAGATEAPASGPRRTDVRASARQ